jgi:hypothetical protein
LLCNTSPLLLPFSLARLPASPAVLQDTSRMNTCFPLLPDRGPAPWGSRAEVPPVVPFVASAVLFSREGGAASAVPSP